ncbi:MAG: ADP-glyceromanno-heptose 6-epimerase [Bacteroidales bacterium]|nr:ADP-glyceromanno-heptose 6-epimerase [Bacteroidales bacterium]
MFVVTGAAGFIGSCMVSRLLSSGIKKVIAVDDFSREDKNRNILSIPSESRIERSVFFEWLSKNYDDVEAIIHLGARTDTTEFDKSVFDELNLSYSCKVWEACVQYNIPLLYASSAATYGEGEFGYKDDHDLIPKLKPLNPYGESKNEFDKWVLKQKHHPPFWAGFKFFNVFGPNEYHKGRMASVVYHSFKQIHQTGLVKLFRSHRLDFDDGMQLRDFVFVGDVVEILFRMIQEKPASGIYNLGSGHARAFLHLAKAVFSALGLEPRIEFVDTPEDIRDKYQYFTEADMGKLMSALPGFVFTPLEDAVGIYVSDYLKNGLYY